MFETAITFYAAHLVADFVVQTDWMVANKKRLGVILLHVVLVMATAAAIAGTTDWRPVLLVGGLHYIIDAWKQYLSGQDLLAFCTDQAGHFLSVIAIAAVFPMTFGEGLWAQWFADPDAYLRGLSIAAGLIATVRMGGFVVDLFIARLGYVPPPNDPGLKDGGYYIGLLERGMIFILVMANQFAGIGFLVAAKSILRFGVSQDRKTSEYIIIGTLASFIWALVAAFATQGVTGMLAQ